MRFPVTTPTRRETPFSLFDKFFGEFFVAPTTPTTDQHRAPVNVSESEKALRLEFEMAGVPEDSLEVEVIGNRLTVRGTRTFETGESQEHHAIEHRYGTIFRQLDLPRGLDTDAIEAWYRHGILSVTVPKSETAQPRKIEIRTDAKA